MIDSASRPTSSAVRVDASAVYITLGRPHGPPSHERWTWYEVAAWSRSSASEQVPAGVTILLRVAPGCTWLPNTAEGYPEFTTVLRLRGVPELQLAELTALADRARHAMVRERLSAFPPEMREEVELIFGTVAQEADGRVQLAILNLADGDLDKVRELAERARADWRGVVTSADERGYRDKPRA
jgi:hypothetical protein